MKVQKALRKIIPSTSMLTYNPFFKALVDLSDIPGRFWFREFRKLPPNHLRIRVGVANRFFSNQVGFLSPKFWMVAFAKQWCDLDSTVMDIGSGCGRQAHFLRDLEFHGINFKGRYIGIDIDTEALAWCRSHFNSDHFTFIQSSNVSKAYNRADGSEDNFRIPVEDNSVDLVFSGSLFTHLLEKEAKNYLKESFRVLRPGKRIAHSVFCMDYPPPTFGDRHTFSHRIGPAYVESMRQPEAAVAYTEAYLLEQAREAGFEDAQLLVGKADWQPILMARKPL